MENKTSMVEVKGGSWYSLARICRSALRDWRLRDNSNDSCGFRIIIEEQEVEQERITLTTNTNMTIKLPPILSFPFLSGFRALPHPTLFPSKKMGHTPITQRQWQEIVELYPECGLNPDPSHFKGDEHPVECITYDECIKWLGLLNRKFQDEGLPYRARIPSEKEWMAWAGDGEYATSTGEISPKLANYDYSQERTTPVRSYPPNIYGMYDMTGNVWEPVMEENPELVEPSLKETVKQLEDKIKQLEAKIAA